MEIALKEVSGSFHPLQMTFTRFLAGGLFLIPFAVRTLKKKRASLNWKDLPGFLLLGFVGMVLSMSIYQMSVKEVPASVVAVLFSSNPIFTAGLCGHGAEHVDLSDVYCCLGFFYAERADS